MKEKLLFWKTSSWIFSLLLLLPILAILYTALGNTDDIFTHLLDTVLPIYTLNTILLVFGAMFFSLILGVPSAWFMAMCRVPTASILQWALVLPLAMPAYIVGYIYTDWLDFAGPIQIALREFTGWTSYNDYWFPDIRTLTGAIIVMSLVLYPYVYLLARAAFMEQNLSLLQSARLLKCTPWQSFKRISLSLARPSIAVALSLVAMEALGDFGTVSYFAVNTLTTAVYDTWLGYSNLNAAAKISAFMLFGILILISSERYSRRKQKMFQEKFNTSEEFQYELHGWKKWLVFTWCWGLVSIAFIFPLLQLISYAIHYFAESWTTDLQQYALNSLYVSFIAAIIAVFIAVIVNFLYRLQPTSKWSVIPMRLASLGYAVPGTVLAIGVMLPMIGLDHFINDLVEKLGFDTVGLLFSGSIIALIFASVTRFSAVAIGSIESNLNKIPPSLDMASRTLGCGTLEMLRRVHFPLIRRGCLVAGLLVFIETMKELNAALLLRPFNFETLATYVFNFASDEQLEVAAMPAVLLVLVGLIPLIIVNRSLEQHN